MTRRTEYEFDGKRLMEDVRARMPKTSLRLISAATGISASTFSRIDQGLAIDIPTFMQICGRLELTPGDYFKAIMWERIIE